jgi:hypothetical protein
MIGKHPGIMTHKTVSDTVSEHGSPSRQPNGRTRRELDLAVQECELKLSGPARWTSNGRARVILSILGGFVHRPQTGN